MYVQHVATAFQMMDLDDSGSIDYEEFQRVCTSIRSPSRPSKFLRTGLKVATKYALPAMRHLKRHFKHVKMTCKIS